MAATRAEVNSWIETAKQTNKKFIISVCDTWDYDDYPVYCVDAEEANKKIPTFNGVNMQKINEIIRINDNGTVKENLSPYNFLK